MKKIKILLAFAAALFVMTTASAQTPSDVNAQFKEAATLIQAKNYGEAIPILKTVIEMGLAVGADSSETVGKAQTLLPECYLRHGQALCSAGNYEEGIAQLNEAVAFGDLYGNQKAARNGRDTISKVYLMMGANAFNAKEYGKAIGIFAKGYEANPTNADLALFLAESYAESGDLDSGLKIYSDVAALESRHSRYKEAADKAKVKIGYYLTIRAHELASSGKVQDAYTMFDNILKNDPDNADIHLMRIQTANNAEQWNRVIEWGEAAANVQSTPEGRSNIYYFLGAAHQNSDNVQSAIAAYEKVVAGGNVVKSKEQIKLLNGSSKK